MFQTEALFSLIGKYESANEEQKTWSGVISEHLDGIYSISVYVLLMAIQRLMVWLVLEYFLCTMYKLANLYESFSSEVTELLAYRTAV